MELLTRAVADAGRVPELTLALSLDRHISSVAKLRIVAPSSDLALPLRRFPSRLPSGNVT
jgi:hypothetical protein